MKISILCVGGSPNLVTEKTIYGDSVQLGVGGAELALFTMCKVWHECGHDVTLYNNPREMGASCFKQDSDAHFNPDEDRDILIYFRGPHPKGINAKGKKIWWSCDQRTMGDYNQLANEVSEIVTISLFHAKYFEDTYGIRNTHVIDLAVREWEYQNVVEKNPLQVIFCSVPDRGLVELAKVWEMVTAQVPEAQLHITSDWRLWDATLPESMVAKYRMMFAGFNNVHYHSLVNRTELIRLQQQSSIHLYPSVYEELFCISAAECQYAGAFPITSNVGALATTNMGYTSTYHPSTLIGQIDLASVASAYLKNPELLKSRISQVMRFARARFGIDTIAEKWEHIFNND
mgnify:CR=1 FL=1